MTTENKQTEVEVDESAASETLKPQNKSEILRDLLSKVAGMSIEDLSHFHNDALALIGKEARNIPDGAATKNQATINMKGSVKEDIAQLFAGDENLTEDFVDRATTLFEAAVEARITVIEQEIQESYDVRLEEEVADIRRELTEQVDAYLDLAVKNWMDENRVAIESSLRNEATAEFIEGLKNLFAEHYIEMPEDRVDVVESQQEKIAALEEMVDALTRENAELKEGADEEAKDEAFEAVSEGLTQLDVERFRQLAEGVDFDGDVEAYQTKLQTVREHYFNKKPVKDTGILSESFEEEASQTEPAKEVDANVARYAAAISRTVKSGR